MRKGKICRRCQGNYHSEKKDGVVEEMGKAEGKKIKSKKVQRLLWKEIFDFSRILFIPCKTNSGTAFFSSLRLPPPPSFLPHRNTLPLKLSPVALHHLLFVFISSFLFSLFFCLFFFAVHPFFFFPPVTKLQHHHKYQQETHHQLEVFKIQEHSQFQNFICRTIAGCALK